MFLFDLSCELLVFLSSKNPQGMKLITAINQSLSDPVIVKKTHEAYIKWIPKDVHSIYYDIQKELEAVADKYYKKYYGKNYQHQQLK